MKTAEKCPTGSVALPRERYLNSRPPTDVPADPPPKPPEDEGGDHKPDPRPFDAFWFGTYGGTLGMEQLETCDCMGWVEEMTEWVRSNGWNFYDRYPHRFYVGKRDPGTKKEIDLPRRDFFRIVAKFKEMNEKYGFCLSGLMIYDKEPSAKPRGSCIECFANGQHVHGDSIGRPLRARLPYRKRRH